MHFPGEGTKGGGGGGGGWIVGSGGTTTGGIFIYILLFIKCKINFNIYFKITLYLPNIFNSYPHLHCQNIFCRKSDIFNMPQCLNDYKTLLCNRIYLEINYFHLSYTYYYHKKDTQLPLFHYNLSKNNGIYHIIYSQQAIRNSL